MLQLIPNNYKAAEQEPIVFQPFDVEHDSLVHPAPKPISPWILRMDLSPIPENFSRQS